MFCLRLRSLRRGVLRHRGQRRSDGGGRAGADRGQLRQVLPADVARGPGGGGGEGIFRDRLGRWNICSCAFAKGKKEGIPVFRFLQKPLTDAFGEEFYAALEAAYERFVTV